VIITEACPMEVERALAFIPSGDHEGGEGVPAFVQCDRSELGQL
jgi:hypothetical protein